VFAGDALRQSVRVGRGARVVLTSQTALQVHPGACGVAATIDQRYEVEDDAELHAHWDPVIPFATARLSQRFDLRLAETARLYWSDAIMAGRVTRGESWRFCELAHELRLTIAGRLSYLERYRLAPGSADPARRWVADRAAYLATLLVQHARADTETAESFHREVCGVPGATAAVDLVEPRLMAGRIAASEGVPFALVRARSRRFVLERLFESPHLAGRKSV
jgi:urease accessory protein UreH